MGRTSVCPADSRQGENFMSWYYRAPNTFMLGKTTHSSTANVHMHPLVGYLATKNATTTEAVIATQYGAGKGENQGTQAAHSCACVAPPVQHEAPPHESFSRRQHQRPSASSRVKAASRLHSSIYLGQATGRIRPASLATDGALFVQTAFGRVYISAQA